MADFDRKPSGTTVVYVFYLAMELQEQNSGGKHFLLGIEEYFLLGRAFLERGGVYWATILS